MSRFEDSVPEKRAVYEYSCPDVFLGAVCLVRWFLSSCSQSVALSPSDKRSLTYPKFSSFLCSPFRCTITFCVSPLQEFDTLKHTVRNYILFAHNRTCLRLPLCSSSPDPFDMNAFLMGFGDLEIEERRPRSWNEPKIKRLSFAKNRRHVLDDRNFSRNHIRNRNRRDIDDWALVPLSSQQRQGNQVQQWDNQRLETQMRFNRQENEHENIMNNQDIQFQELKQRQRFMQAEQLRHFMFPPQPMHHRPEQGMQHHGGQQQLPPPPPQHGRGGGGGDPRMMNLGAARGGPRLAHGSDDEDDDFEPGNHQGGSQHNGNARPGGRGRSQNRHDDFRPGGRQHGHHATGGGHRDDDSESSGDERVEVLSCSDSDDDRGRRPPRMIGGGRRQRLPRVFRPRSHSRGSRHQSRHRSRSRSRRGIIRRHIRPLYSDDSDSEDNYETHVRFARRPSRSRGSLRRSRSRGRHFDFDSDDSFEELDRWPRRRLRSRSRGPRLSSYISR